MHAYGPAAKPTWVLNWVFSGVTVGVCIIIAGLLIAALVRKRPSLGANEIHRSNKNELRWISIGTGISTVILFIMATYALIVLNQTATMPHKPQLTITVTGYDWWWKVEYPDFVTANEIHIPVGVPVLINLKSADVIHGFWVPQLAGKTEMIPGLTNRQWLQADKPGVYHGKCTQFCGLQHAHMDFEVIADTPADYKKWLENQRKPAVAALLAEADSGQQIFVKQCAACHTIRGGKANGNYAPDLTHLESREMIAAGMLKNTPENLADWVQHAQDIKPGSQMPNIELSPAELSALSAYLATLK